MEIWDSHWHCLLPFAAILIAMFVMQRGDKSRAKNTETE